MNYSNLMDAVNARIKANGRREITGDILNDVLRAMVVELGAGYQLGGTIRPGDKPKDEDLRVAYLAVEPGMYLYAGGFEVTELSLITYGAEWYMYPLGVPFGSQIAEDISAAVEAEKTRAMAAEKVLSDTIATERSERAAADSALDSAVKAETKRATDAEGVLAKAVEDEKARAMAAEGANASAITAEADARAKSDTALQRNISAEETAREAADDALAAKVTAEEAARKAADATLQANINTEESERKAADTALQGNIDKKQDTISDLATIRANAANGQTAFGWGDHAKAGYVKPFVIAITGDGSTENPYAVDKTREEVAAALAANSLILLKGSAADFPGYSEIYPLIWATNSPTQALVLQFGNINEARLIYTTMVLVFSYQEGVGVSVMASSTKLATDEQVKAKMPTIQAGTGENSEVFNGIAPASASGNHSHAEGRSTTASGVLGAHAEGNSTHASGQSSHAEGFGNNAIGDCSHVEGQETTANGANSHAEGYQTTSVRQCSHAEGQNNVSDGAAIHQVGIGEEDFPKDAHRITYDGKHYIPGIGGFDGTKATRDLNGEKDLATVINEYETRIAALETALAGIKSN